KRLRLGEWALALVDDLSRAIGLLCVEAVECPNNAGHWMIHASPCPLPVHDEQRIIDGHVAQGKYRIARLIIGGHEEECVGLAIGECFSGHLHRRTDSISTLV